MFYVDKDIKKFGNSVINNYNEDNVSSMSYDIAIDNIILGKNELASSYRLRPGEMVMIQTREEINVPENMTISVGEKNSKLRAGLFVSGPRYFPGHKTRVFLRVKNISSNIIDIESGDNIAQLFFEDLSGVPDKPYNKQEGASFNDEDVYRGFGNYKDEFDSRIEKIQEEDDKLRDHENHIYANILTLMGIFVSIFSLIMVNFSNISRLSKASLLRLNFSLGFVIAVFMGLIFLFINAGSISKGKSKWCIIAYGILLAIMIIALVII